MDSTRRKSLFLPQEMFMANSILPFDINQFSFPERVAMIGEIWDSMVDEPSQIPLTQAQLEELDRRIAESKATPEDVVPWEEIEIRLFGDDR
jgi:putative addiction module component (TIGR02574 family)